MSLKEEEEKPRECVHREKARVEKEAETALIETYGTLKRLWSFSYKQGRASDGL